jgi:hypothetical protein
MASRGLTVNDLGADDLLGLGFAQSASRHLGGAETGGRAGEVRARCGRGDRATDIPDRLGVPDRGQR